MPSARLARAALDRPRCAVGGCAQARRKAGGRPESIAAPHDPSLDTLVDLDGEVLVVDPEGGHWVRFVVTRVPVPSEKPHLLADFWDTVDSVLRERGILT
jgi:hypothetical protein